MNDLSSLEMRCVSRSAVLRRRFQETIGVGATWYCLVVSFEVDTTLIQEMLALTPTQRIRQNDRVLRMIEELRNGLAESGKPARDARVERR